MATTNREKYGLNWEDQDDIQIEMSMIERGGYWVIDGQKCGLGLFEHFMRARELLWPDRYRHRWTDLIYNEIINNIVTVLMGAGSTGKTSTASEYCLIDYWAHPRNTLVIVTTVTLEKLDSAVFGEITMLHQQAQQRWPHLAGHRLASRRAISTDDLKENGMRDIRKGFLGKALYAGRKINRSSWVGLSSLAGTKQERIRCLCDEIQFVNGGFIDSLPNLFQGVGLGYDGQPEIKIIPSGNPKHDPFDQLSVAAEPVAGWDSVANIEKTTVWPIKFERGKCVNLIGTDSPNFDPPVCHIPRYPRLISQNTINLVLKRWKKDSLQYYSQCLGKMVMGMIGDRVITKQLCDEHKAFDKPVWRDADHTKIGFLDPAWGGINADRCIWGWLRFGLDLRNITLMELVETQIVPIMATSRKDPDDQIAEFVKMQALLNDIPADNIFYDSTGRGTTGAAFAKVFGSVVPVPVAFGDKPSQRPVRHDLFIQEANGHKRHKRCDEEYGKRVTELWFAVRNVIECDQFRGMTEDVCREGCMREYTMVGGGKIDVETKDETRERMGESPDLFDGLAVGVEGARQRGFKTQRLGWEIIEQEEDNEDFFETEALEYAAMIRNQLLKH